MAAAGHLSLGASSVAGRIIEFTHPSLTATVALEQCPEKSLNYANADGTCARVWPTSLAFGRYLCAHPELVRNKRVVELGAGTGVAGLICAALGASHVTITDMPEALKLVRANVARNDAWLKPGQLSVAPCTWGDEGHLQRLLQAAEPPSETAAAAANGAGGNGAGAGAGGRSAFDVVLSCECVYKQPAAVLEALVETQRRLTGPSSLNIVVYEFRGDMVPDLPFFEAITDAFAAEPEASSLRAFEDPPQGAVEGEDDEDCRYVYIYRNQTGG